jgi:hypothetical protein
MKIVFARAPTLHLQIGAATVRAEARRGRTVVWAGEETYASLDELTDAIARLAAEPSVSCRRVAVLLERPPVQLRTLTDLPPVKERELAALVEHQAPRYFRRNGKPLVTDAVWMGMGPSRVVRAAAVEEPLVEAIVAGARAAGLVVETIGPAENEAPLLLLPGVERAVRARRRRRMVRTFGLLAGGLWVGAIGGFFIRLVLERRAVERELAALRQPLATVLDARRTIRVAAGTVAAVAQAQRGRGRSMAVLGAVTAALPDSAVLTSFAWSADGTGVMTGLAKRAAEVLARLERNGAVTAPRFDGPIVKEAIGGREWERFTIVFGGDP